MAGAAGSWRWRRSPGHCSGASIHLGGSERRAVSIPDSVTRSTVNHGVDVSRKNNKTPRRHAAEGFAVLNKSAEANLGKDALAGQQLGAEADDEAKHGQAAVPGLSEVDETEAGGGVGHGEEPVG